MRNLSRGVSFAAVIAVLTCSAAVAAPAHAQTSTGGASPSASPTTTTAPSTTPAPSATPAPAPASGTAVETRTVKLTRSQTKTVQRRVKVRPDGALGSRTRSAIRRYQGRKKLKRTGRPNIQTLRAMKLKLADKLAAEANRTAATPETAPAAGSGAKAIAAAREAIGTPYGSGGNGPDSYDCSGLTVMAFKAAGVTLPRTSFEQYKEGTEVERSAIQPGDLVFFDTAGSGASHVGVATSATKVVSATTSGVKEHSIDDSYWSAHYVGARRVAG